MAHEAKYSKVYHNILIIEELEEIESGKPCQLFK